MKKNDTLNPLWAGFLDMIQGIFVIEIGVYFYYMVLTGGMLP
jgi:hypothetical protein